MTSPARITAIAGNTLTELIRQKVFYFMLLFATVAIGAAFGASVIPFVDAFQLLKDASLGAMTIFSWLLATLATAMILPKDLEDRTLYTILAKPVSRLEYLLGKLLGVLLLLAVALALMSVLFAIALLIRERLAIANTLQSYGVGPDGQAAIAEIKRAAFGWKFAPAVLVVFTKAAVCASLTLLLSTFATSWIFTVMVSVCVYVIGHLQPLVREALFENPSALLKAFLGFVALLFPDFQLFNVVDEIAVGNAVPAWMFGQTFGLGLGYIFIYTLVGYIAFANREL